MAAVRSLLAALAMTITLAVPAAAGAAVQGWTSPGTITDFDVTSVAMTDDGTAILAGRAYSGVNEAPALRIRPAGGAFGAPLLLSPYAPGTPLAPQVAAIPGGGAVVAWLSGGLVTTARIAPGATTLSGIGALPVTGGSASSTGAIALAADGSGTAHLLWLTSTPSGMPGSFTDALVAGTKAPDGSGSAAVVESGTTSLAVSHSWSHLQIKVGSGGAAIASWMHSVLNDNAETNTESDETMVHAAGLPWTSPATLATITNTFGGSSNSYLSPPVIALRGITAAVVWGTLPGGGTANETLRAGVLESLSGRTLWRNGDLSLLGSTGGYLAAPQLTIPPSGGALVGWATGGVSAVVQTVRWTAGRGAGTLGTTQSTVAPYPAASFAFVDGDPEQLAIEEAEGAGRFDLAASRWDDAAGGFGAPVTAATGLLSGSFAPLADTGPAGGVIAWTQGDTDHVVGFAGLDETPPVVRASIPSGGPAGGAPLSFGASATDVWGPVTLRWDFGDGAPGVTGASVTHAFGAAGTPTVTVTATDAAGNSAQVAQPVAITAPIPPGGGGGSGVVGGAGGAARDLVAPKLSSLAIDHTKFLPTERSRSSKRSRTPRGATFRMTLSEAATVTITIARTSAGLRHGKSCVAPTARLRRSHARSCTRTTTVGTLSGHLPSGRATLAFTGHIKARALPSGRYATTAIATDAAGNHSRPIAGPPFTIA